MFKKGSARRPHLRQGMGSVFSRSVQRRTSCEASALFNQQCYTECHWVQAPEEIKPRASGVEHWLQDLDSQRTNPREYQIWELTQKKPHEYKTLHHPTTSCTLCRMPHLNNKENKNTNHIISIQDNHRTQPCPSEEKQTNKNAAQISPYMKLTQTTGPTLAGKKPKGRKNSTFFKERNQLSLKPGKSRPQTQ